MEWLRRSFITGFFVTVPMVISVVTFVWIFSAVDGLLGPVFARWIGYDIPGLGLLTTVAGVVVIGAVATNVLGKRILQRGACVDLVVRGVKQHAAGRDPHDDVTVVAVGRTS